MAYLVSDTYKEIIYSQDDRNDIKIWFNNVELENAGYYCESLKRVARVMPDDGKSRFSIDNFISTNVQLILHNIDTSIIKDQVKISIGTLVDEIKGTYEYIPIGRFNIQNTPTTDKGKTTISLRDNRVKFDKPYNAKPLMDSNGGTATKRQILDDICSTFGVEHEITSFDNEDDVVGIYDSTIYGNIYISYLAEQGGYIPAINRNGKLIFVDLNNLYIWRIPLSILGDYKIGTPFTVQRVVYESGIIKYETSNDTTLDTLYLNSANPYISNQLQVDNILNKLNNFKIDTVSVKKILGNPAIDPYDLIQVYVDIDENGNYLPKEKQTEILFTTFANTTYTYNGVHRDNFDTQIGIEERKENVTLTEEPTFRKWAKTEIDNVNAEVTVTTANVDDLTKRVNKVETKQTTTDFKIDIISTNINMENGNLERIETVNGYTFNEEGFKIGTNENDFNALHNNVGTYYKDGETVLSQTTKDGTITRDLVLYGRYYYGVDEDLDVANFKKDDAMFVAQLYTNSNNEEGFGHFWNSN